MTVHRGVATAPSYVETRRPLAVGLRGFGIPYGAMMVALSMVIAGSTFALGQDLSPKAGADEWSPTAAASKSNQSAGKSVSVEKRRSVRSRSAGERNKARSAASSVAAAKPVVPEKADEAPKTGTVKPSIVPTATTATTVATKGVAKSTGKVPVPPAAAARQLFGAAKDAAALPPKVYGFYSKGCLAGARSIAIDGPAWQVMRLSRNRFWGHPELVATIERLARDAQKDGWPGLLVGDLAQPRGGPMLTGHASHQIGLDADIWLTPMPKRRFTRHEREETSATSMLGPSKVEVDAKVWTPQHVRLIKRAASYPRVERVLVHPAIKKALCAATPAADRAGWLAKVRPYWGHHYHMHIRYACPADSPGCRAQAAVGSDDGCGKELTDWLKRVAPRPPAPPVKPTKPVKPVKPKPPITLADLPRECVQVLEAAESKTRRAGAE